MDKRLLIGGALLVGGALLFLRGRSGASIPEGQGGGGGFTETVETWISEVILDPLSGKGTARSVIRQVQNANPGLAYIPEQLVIGIIETESGFSSGATGAAGEYGYMQIHPVTFQWLANKVGLSGIDPYDEYTNVFLGMYYLNLLFDMFEDWEAVIQAYNVGPGAYTNGKRNAVYLGKVLSAMANA